MRTPSIKTRLILALTLILCIAFLATSVVNYHVSKSAIRREIVTSSLPLTRDNIFSEIQGDLVRPLFISSIMANDAFLKQWAEEGENDVGRITKYLKDIRNKYDFISTFFVSARTLNYYHFKGIHKKIRPTDPHDVWFYRFVALHEEYDLDVDTDEAADNLLTIFINFRVESDDGTLLGVTGVGLEMNTVAGLLGSYQKKYGRTIYMTDTDGRVQLHSDPSLVEKVSIRKAEGVRNVADRILSGGLEPINVEFKRNGHRVLLSSRFIPEIKWYLIVEQQEEGAFAAIRSNMFRNLAVGAAAIVIVVGIVAFTVNRYQSRLEAMAVTDELTGLANRRAFEDQFARAAYRFARTGEPFSVLVMDLDGFKAVNDRCGHLAGDRLLKRVGEIVTSQIRLTDFLARWGGDEFIVLLDGEAEPAGHVADRIRTALAIADLSEENARPDDPRPLLTASIGVSAYRQGDTLDSVTQRADEAMYQAKTDGGNQVTSA